MRLLFLLPLLIACTAFRPPAVPLVAVDPFFNIWSTTDHLADFFTEHWSGVVMDMAGFALIDNKPFRFMGPEFPLPGANADSVAPQMEQRSVLVGATQTKYLFWAAGVSVALTFSTPATLQNRTFFDLPITVISAEVLSTDASTHNVSLYFDIAGEVVASSLFHELTWERESEGKIPLLKIGTVAQDVFSVVGDFVNLDWGYLLASFPESSEQTLASFADSRYDFLTGKKLPGDDRRKPRMCVDMCIVAAGAYRLGLVGSESKAATFVLGYDDIVSLNYYGHPLKASWKRRFRGAGEMMMHASQHVDEIVAVCEKEDRMIKQSAEKHGAQYATLISLIHRQVMSATKMVQDYSGSGDLLFMKEVSSDGDVSTVDVIFPASPLFLYHAPDMLALLLEPVLRYANNETNIHYSHPWAPHHLGVWPVADATTARQENMPNEETANMLIMISAISIMAPELQFPERKYLPLLSQWASFLVQTAVDPGDQLCTDDFTGPSPHNANLAAKGIVGLAAYGKFLNVRGLPDGDRFIELAKRYATRWVSLASDGDHYKLEYDKAHTWSLKYNIFWQYFFDVPIFPEDKIQMELVYYETKMAKFGVPLDCRATFTKLDWESWIAAMSPNETFFRNMIERLYNFADSTPQRVGLTDWYDTTTGNKSGFQNRPVLGALYAKLLLDKRNRTNVRT